MEAEAKATGKPSFTGTPGPRHIVVELSNPLFGWCDDEILPKHSEGHSNHDLTWHIYNRCGHDVEVELKDFKEKKTKKGKDPRKTGKGAVMVPDKGYSVLTASIDPHPSFKDEYKYTLVVTRLSDKETHDHDPELIIY